MTSIEFAAKYRLLKNVATRGARSFLAQQVQLGRMVMVHYLDSENHEERMATLAQLDALRPPARDKLLEVADVDGTPVAVTLFISSFKDFASWLDSAKPPASQSPSVAPAVSQPGEFTRMFNKVTAPTPTPIPAPVSASKPEYTPEPARKPEPAKKAPGDFTRIFGKVEESAPTPSAPPRNEDEIKTVIMEAVKPPQAAPPVSSKPVPTPKPAPTQDSGASFTAIFGAVGEAPHSIPDLPPSAPAPMSSAAPRPVMPPPPAVPDFRPTAPSPAPQPAAASQPGEFTQLFQRLSPSGGVTPPSPLAAAPFAVPDVQRPLEPLPRADAPPPPPSAPTLGAPSLAPPSFGAASLGAPSLGSPSLGQPSAPPPLGASLAASLGAALPAPSLGSAPPVIPPAPPRQPDVPATPYAAPQKPFGASMFGSPAPSEFTRILSPISAPPPPPVPIQAPAAAAAAAAAAARPSKSMLPLIIGLTSVIVLTIAIVAYFVMRK